MNSLINHAKHEDKLRKIIRLNEVGSTIYTDKSSEALAFGCSKSEFVEALKKDIDKTAKDLVDSSKILLSINNDIVVEVKSLDNNVESFFGTTYNKIVNKITLSGVRFYINENTFPSKNEIVESIYFNILHTTKKDLRNLSKALTLYETTTDKIKKTLLYPSVILADELIEKVGHINTKFNNFRNTMEFKEKLSYDTTFRRSGVSEVIQNSTYINNDGILQCTHKEKSVARRIASKLMNNEYKYIEAVEIDGDADCSKVFNLIRQIERFKINSKHKFTLKFRKLGNLNARGVFFQSGLIVAEDVRDTSAILHEIAHFIHLTNSNIYNHDFVNYMINKLSGRINFNNLNVPELEAEAISKKNAYYTDSKEVIARALEVAALFAFENGKFIQSTEEFDLIKSRAFYTKYEGIYFDFSSFDEETINEMKMLYSLFYETTYDEVLDTNIDNFVKIDTNYSRIEKEKDAYTILKEDRKRNESEKKALFSLVTSSNLELIIQNKNSLSLRELAIVIMTNISYCGGHNKSMSPKDWSHVCDEKSCIILYLLEKIKKELTNKDYIDFLYQLKKTKVLETIKSYALAEGFSISGRIKIKSFIKANIEDSHFFKLQDEISLMTKTPLFIADNYTLNDKSFISKIIDIHPLVVQNLENLKGIEKENLVGYFLYFLEQFPTKTMFLSESSIFSDERILDRFLLIKDNVTCLSRFNSYQINNESLFNLILNRFPDSKEKIFEKVDDKLKNNYEFMSKHVSLNINLKKFIGKEIKHLFFTKQPKKNQKDIAEDKPSLTEEGNNINIEFDDLIKAAEIVDFTHTESGEILKVFKIKEKIDDFKSFNKYVIKNGIAYYSRIANGFIIKNIDKVASITSTTLYSQDLIDVFSSGKLF